MLRLALVSAATYGPDAQNLRPGSHHGTAFTTAFNGFDDAKSRQWEWTFIRCGRRIPGARVVKLWDRDRTWVERLAEVCAIDEIADSPEAAAEGVDAVLVIDDGSREQWKLAVPAIERGLPVFIDKPLAMTAAEAGHVLRLAEKHGARVMSASSLRYVPDIQAAKAKVPELEPVNLATTICGNGLVYYGIHALEMAYEVLGSGAVSVMNVGQEGRNICRVRFESGRDLVLMVAEGEHMRAGYQLCLHGKRGWHTVQPDLTDLYVYLLEAFMPVAQGGPLPVPPAEQHEVIATLEAGVRSLQTGREISVRELMAEG